MLYGSRRGVYGSRVAEGKLGLSKRIDLSRTWIDTFSQDPESALDTPRDIDIGIYSDSSLVTTKITVGKNARKGNAVHLRLDRHWGWSAFEELSLALRVPNLPNLSQTHPDEILKQDVTIVEYM